MAYTLPRHGLAVLSCIAAALALAGCGGGSSEAEAAKNAPKGVFISTSDCANSGVLDHDTCSKGVSAAISEHNEKAPSYVTERACETAEGTGRCERSIDTRYRRRLIAYFVRGGEKPEGKALYVEPSKDGYVDLKKAPYLESDATLTFSTQALASFQQHRGSKKYKAQSSFAR
ncbi:MAG: DUF1190 domain-containing protein [Hyphomicrobiaceae bacterium]|nr:DUF1190 domain-containing protein [Hyphomicrobiaceae bacterium]